MINLLPPDMKQDMHYGRRDMILLHWIFACLVALTGVGLIVGAGFFYLQHSISNQTASLKQSQETLKSMATDITAATQLQLNLQDPNNKIFDKADIEDITCIPPDPSIKYLCTVQLRAQFAKDNPYVYISPPAGSTKK
jgi:cell division protein FtsB